MFTTLLQHRLGARTVMNLGLPGAGTEHEYLAYRRYVGALKPGLVIAIVCVAWDIDNTLHFERWRTEKPDGDFTRYRMTYFPNAPDPLGAPEEQAREVTPGAGGLSKHQVAAQRHSSPRTDHVCQR